MSQQLLVPAGVRVLLFNRLSRTQSLPTSARLPLPGAAYPIFMPAGERSAHDYCSGRARMEQDSEEPTSALETGCTENPCRVRVGRRVVDTSGGEPIWRGPGRSPGTVNPRNVAAQVADR